jgi:Tfp pilus assembly protein FimT
MYKKSFSLIEIIFVIVLISVISSYTIQTNNQDKLVLAKNQIKMHLKYMRYIAMLDNKYDHNDKNWYRKAWNVKFRWCSGKKQIHYYIYSDLDNSGHVKEEETLKDPLTNNRIYSTISCKDNSKRTNYTLLSKYYGVKTLDISCNDTSSLGQILFLNTGIAYSKFTNNENIDKYKIQKDCKIDIYDKYNSKETITVTGNTGYIY